MIACCGAGWWLCPAAAALQRTIRTKIQNYPNAPVELRRPRTTLTETFATPTQAHGGAAARRSRIRYANREGLDPSSFLIEGEVECQNRSANRVEAIALTVVALNAFHEPLSLPGQRQAYAEQQVVAALARGASTTVRWEQAIGSSDVYEVAVVVTRVRFADGSVWSAPREELIEIF